jgi:hypothetical protein
MVSTIITTKPELDIGDSANSHLTQTNTSTTISTERIVPSDADILTDHTPDTLRCNMDSTMRNVTTSKDCCHTNSNSISNISNTKMIGALPESYTNDDRSYSTQKVQSGVCKPYQRKVDDMHWTVLAKILFFYSHYGIRLISVSLSWFLWDVAFYGNKLFQSTFLFALTNNGDDQDGGSKYRIQTMLQISLAAMINASIALCGYYAAAFIIDHPFFGRRKLQLYGFLLTGFLFISVGLLYDYISSILLICLYFGTSFFGQCGPNATTFILPSEVFPTQLRTICHGVAAASGKFGALIATIVFHRISNDVDLFLISGYTSFIAVAITYWFVPETLGHDLRENDIHWKQCVESYDSKSNEYPQNPLHLSVYERRRHQLWNGVS